MEAGESAGAQGALLRKRADEHRTQAAESVGAALERLREQGYDVLHDVRWPGRRRANIDHVAIGSAGVLVVDARDWSGAVTTHRGRLRQDGHPRDKEIEGVLRASVDVAALLSADSVPQVIPVLCLAGEHHVAPIRCAEVTVVDVSRLTDWVCGLPLRLSPAEVADLVVELRRQLPPASGPVPGQIKRRRKVQPVERAAAPADTEPVAVVPVAVVPVAVVPVAPQWPSASAIAVAPRSRAFVKIALLLAALLVLPAVAFWWSANGSGVISEIFPPAEPSIAAVAPVIPAYHSCRALRVGHPGGIASPGAKNTGRKLRPAAVVTTSQSLYAANARLDTDGDHIACEVVRKRHHK
jgi:Nuclease-related domain/Excalibur calcium-binding domain